MQRIALILLIVPLTIGVLACAGDQYREEIETGARHYRFGRCAEALEAFAPALEAKVEDGPMMFQAYDCMRRTGDDPVRQQTLREAAMAVLQPVVDGESPTLAERFYLAAIQYDAGDPNTGGQIAFAAIQAIPDPAAANLEAIDYYHLGRIYDLMRRQDLAAEWFYQAAERFETWEDPPTWYFGRSLMEAARFDLAQREYEAAVGRIDRARELDPDIRIEAQLEGMVMMGARRFEAAQSAWYRITEPADLVLESNTRARLAQKAVRYKTLPRRGPTGRLLPEYSDEEIQVAIRELVPELNEFRQTFYPGWRNQPNGPAFQLSEMERETLLRGLRKAEREFLALNLEYLLRGHLLHEFASRNGYIHLLRQ